MKIRVNNSGLLNLQLIRDKKGDGDLYIAEALKHTPFKIRRIYFIRNPRRLKVIRGLHAHKKFLQAIFCINGSFKLSLDDGQKKQSLTLKNPGTGILLGPKLWHSMTNLTKDCVILVLASDYYKESDYIRKYEHFLEYLKKQRNSK